MSVMITSLLRHFLLQPCSVVFDPFHPGQTHCITHSPFTAAHAESHTCTLKAIVQLRTSHKLTMQFLDTLQIQYSLLLTLNVLWQLLKQYVKHVITPLRTILHMKMKVLQWHHQLAEQWPQIIPECHKLQLLNNFQELMSSNQLKHHTCAICGESKFNQEVLPKPMPITLYDLSILHGLYPAPHLNPFPMHPSLCNTIVCSQGILNNCWKCESCICTASLHTQTFTF